MAKGDLRSVWVGTDEFEGERMEQEAIKKYGDAMLSSGPVKINGKTVYGYSVFVPENLYKKNKSTSQRSVVGLFGKGGLFR
jgi:hypothetical protein